MSSMALSGVERDAVVSTWFGVGGRADRLARPGSVEELASLVRGHDRSDGPLRVLGDGANLLVDDGGVDGLVIDTAAMRWVEKDGVVWRVGAGARLPRLVVESVREGLAGLEGLGGVPASVGGAVRMNAGGAYGQMADVVRRVEVVGFDGVVRAMDRGEIGFGYRESGIEGVVASVELGFAEGDGASLRDRLKEVMAAKKASQPLGERSAGCAFKNPVVDGVRESAGKMIDGCGCKGMRVGGAWVSEVHANFIAVDAGATAGDVIALMDEVARVVLERRGVALEREVVVWRRGEVGDG